jgi:hypothetical protein
MLLVFILVYRRFKLSKKREYLKWRNMLLFYLLFYFQLAC